MSEEKLELPSEQSTFDFYKDDYERVWGNQEEMKAITIWQPFATLIQTGDKYSETRNWIPPKEVIGQRIAIHAAKKKLTRDYLRELPTDIHTKMTEHFGPQWINNIPYGAVVCTAMLKTIYQITYPNPFFIEQHLHIEAQIVAGHNESPNNRRTNIRFDYHGDYGLGRYIWELTEVEPLTEPIPEIGEQRFWNWDPYNKKSGD